MSNKRITELTDIGTPASSDVLEIVDVSDTTDSPEGTSKKVLVSALGGGGSQNLQQVTDEGNITTNEVVSSNNSGITGASITPNGVFLNQTDGGNSTNLKSTHEDGYLEVDFVDGGTNATREWVTANVSGGDAIVVSSNTTASNDTNYNVVANATFTDPTPVEGKGYVVFVRNGTATIGGVGYSVGRIIYRVFHSGAWSSTIYVDQAYIDAKVADSITDGVTTIAPSQNAVFDALALKSDKTSWVDYSAISTIVGFSSFTTREIWYMKINDHLMIVLVDIFGPSNSTTFTITISELSAFNGGGTNVLATSNSVSVNASGRWLISAGSDVVEFRASENGTAFSASGNKGCKVVLEIKY